MKRLLYIFIPFLAILLMSHNTSAITLNIPVEKKDTIQSPYWRYYVSGVGDSSWSNASTVNRKASDANITRIQLRDNANHDIAFTAGDYIVMNIWADFYLAQFTNTDPLQLGYFDITNASSNCNIIKLDTISQNWAEGSSVTSINNWLRWEGTITCDLRTSGTNPTVNLTIKSNGISSSIIEGNPNIVRFGIKSYSVYGVNEHDVNAEQEQATQEASDDSADAGDSSSSDAEDASSSLISAIGGFVNAVTSASPSNCNINGDMGNFDIGSIDLCANPVPTFVQIISSLVLIAICIPFAIIMFNRFIGMFRSFQG